MGIHLKTLASKKLPKNDREQAVLFGLIDLYLNSSKPIGSQTLQENGFESLSSATIRNYFAKLESLGYLLQPHTSGGRVPTGKAFRFYADVYQDQGILDSSHGEILEEVFRGKNKEIGALVHQASEMLSKLSKCAVFISMPRFDQDFIQEVKLIPLDPMRLLAIIITDFGLVRTETIYLEQEVDSDFIQRCEKYFMWRLNKGENITFEREMQTKQAQRIYNETMVRHVVGYLNFSTEEVMRCGVSRLLAYPEFSDASAVVNSLSLLENQEQMRNILRDCCRKMTLSYWVGDELCPHVAPSSENTVIAIPYKINQMVAGAVALMGPLRLPYRELFGLMRHFSELMTSALTDTVYKHKITFRQPNSSGEKRIESDHDMVKANRSVLLENKTR
ncbi:MAG: Heat-inducible transcription repressor HrcA [Parachlamydiales bacterium]|nr:Heat-inducible transcription repressor HrcA [Parachlamydiales bacterium]